MIKIVTDSACDVPVEIAEKLGITVVPVFINVGEQSYEDGVEMTRQMFLRAVVWLPSTPPARRPRRPVHLPRCMKHWRLRGATNVLSIHIAQSLSNTLNAARLGARSHPRRARHPD